MFIDNGCIVIVMYSMDSDFSKDDNLVQKYCSHFQLAFPNPKVRNISFLLHESLN